MATRFEGKRYDVEHALNLMASNAVHFPADGIYDKDLLRQLRDKIRKCHIYLIGLVPKIVSAGFSQDNGAFVTAFEIGANRRELRWPIPSGASVVDEDGRWTLVDEQGEKKTFDMDIARTRLQKEATLGFEVLYVGQAFGTDGRRNAVDRLKRHETLQKIALQGLPPGYALHLLLLEVLSVNRLTTLFNPKAKERDDDAARISRGVDTLYSTTEAERVTLFEASLIRYFQPEFNKLLKDSFPSTNMLALANCYRKDIAAITAELCFGDLPFSLFTSSISGSDCHVISHDLHGEEARKVFFSQA